MVPMTEYKWFRSLSTGKVGKYPAHFASRPSLEEVSSEDAGCLNCLIEPLVADEHTQSDDLDTVVAHETVESEVEAPAPKPTPTSRKSKDN